jgi:hypothetical protein
MKAPMSPAERIQRAKDTLDNGGPADLAIALALIAIAELLPSEAADQ